ncbi:MAG TPA: hypothetical protein VKT83_13760 [bacterium]|nr:hypothetical protein [bacterium]
MRLGGRVLVLDTETTTDQYQNLLFGAFHIYEHKNGRYHLVHKGLILGDVLTQLQTDAIGSFARDNNYKIYSRYELVRHVFFPEVYEAGTLCVGFNLPFDLSRLAVRAVPGRKRWRGGFTLYLVDSKWFPGIHVKSIDNKRAFIEFVAYSGLEKHEATGHRIFPGRFLDLRTLAFALTGTGHSLASACGSFGTRHQKFDAESHGAVSISYLRYSTRDVLATWELYEALVAEWNRHPFAIVPTPFEVGRQPEAFLITHAYSPASLGKAYMRAMGIRPFPYFQPQFRKAVLGHAMVSYFGGRSECHIRRRIVPVTYVDVLSMYPTVCVLQGLWKLIFAREIRVEDVTDEIRSFLDGVTLADFFKPATWARFSVLVEVDPRGAILPVRAPYVEDGDYQIGLNMVGGAKHGLHLWYTLADAVASKLLCGRSLVIRRALRLRPVGVKEGLRSVKLLGEVHVDPRTDDFFRVLIEKRHTFQQAKRRAELAGDDAKARYFDGLQHGLKILANAMSYGIFAEIDEKLTGAKDAEIFGLRHFSTSISKEEHPGPFAFAPLAAFITGGARLLLAMCEVELSAHGATYAFCDTDSMAIVGLSETVKVVRERFAALTPYTFGGDLLKLEDENIPDPRAARDKQLYCYSISAKRYVLFNIADDGSILLRKSSEHGLGHLLSPYANDEKKWMEQLWTAVLRWEQGQDANLGQSLSFADLPALGVLPISNAHVWERFDRINTKYDPRAKKRVGRPSTQQVKPFNFMLVAYPATGDVTTGGEAYWSDRPNGRTANGKSSHQPIRPIAPYERYPRKWPSLPWVDLHTGRPVSLAWGSRMPGFSMGLVRVQTYRDVLHRYVTHPEAKAAGRDGLPCAPHTKGALSRLRVHITDVVHIGKESNELDEVQAGLVIPRSAYVYYLDRDEEANNLRSKLKQIPRRFLQREAGLSRAMLKRTLNRHTLPHRKNRLILMKAAKAWQDTSH